MAVYYKFKSGKDYFSVPIDGQFISVSNLKQNIFKNKHLGSGTDYDLLISNAQTNEDYVDEAMLIPKNTSVLVRRVPGPPRIPIVTEPKVMEVVENNKEGAQQVNTTYPVSDSNGALQPEENEWDAFGDDLYAIPEVLSAQSTNPVQYTVPPTRADEDSKIKAFVDDSALGWERQIQEASGSGRGYGRGSSGTMAGGRNFGRSVFERKAVPPGYVCHRCKIPGHLIQYCPTNGDPNYDIKRVKQPTGVPKAMLVANADGSYALQDGGVAVMKPDEAAFDKEMEGLTSSTRSIIDIPQDLLCPVCKEVMKDAVLTSKCCFRSFCDKCIRTHIISQMMCVCGATNVLADNLLPNMTVRATINRLMETSSGSTENAGSISRHMGYAQSAEPKVSSLTLSTTSKGEKASPSSNKEKIDHVEIADEANRLSNSPQQPQESVEKPKSAKVSDVSEAPLPPVTVKGTLSPGGARLANSEVQQNPSVSEPGKKKKKKKVLVPTNGDIQWGGSQGIAAANYMMPYTQPACNMYWGGMQLGIDEFINPYAGTMPYAGMMPYIGFPQDPFIGQGYMMPVPPHRNHMEFLTSQNLAHPVKKGEEFEARKANLRRNPELQPRVERDSFKDGKFRKEVGRFEDIPSIKSKDRLIPQPASLDHSHTHRNEREISLDHSHHHHRQHRQDETKISSGHISSVKSKDKFQPASLDDHHNRRTDRKLSMDHSSHHRSHHQDERRCISPDRSRHHHQYHRQDQYSRYEKETTSLERPPREIKQQHKTRRTYNDEVEPLNADKKKKRVSSERLARKSSKDDYESSDDDDDEERHFKRRRSWYDSRDKRGTTSTHHSPLSQVRCF